MENLKELVSLCKASVSISVNKHKDYYEMVEHHIESEEKLEIEKEVLDEMIKRDTVVMVVAYPLTPVSFYVVHHYDIDTAIEIMLNLVKKRN